MYFTKTHRRIFDHLPKDKGEFLTRKQISESMGRQCTLSQGEIIALETMVNDGYIAKAETTFKDRKVPVFLYSRKVEELPEEELQEVS